MVYYLYAPAREYLTVCSRDNHEDESFLFIFMEVFNNHQRKMRVKRQLVGRDEEGD